MQEQRPSALEAPVHPAIPSGTSAPGASPTGTVANSSEGNTHAKFAPPTYVANSASFTCGVSPGAHTPMGSHEQSTSNPNVSAPLRPDPGATAPIRSAVPSFTNPATTSANVNQLTTSASARPLNSPHLASSTSLVSAATPSPVAPFPVYGSSSASGPTTPVPPLPSNPLANQHVYPPFASAPSVGASPQAVWLQPPQMGAFPRPPFLSYAPVYPVPFPLPARGMPLPSVPLPDSQPPGVTPVGNVGSIAISSSAAPANQMTIGSATRREVQIPEGRKGGSDVNNLERASSSDQEEAWSAHRTETGVVYYYHAVTGESTYQKPVGFKGEVDKVIALPTPVSWEKLASTDWTLVTTNDGKKYYYNTKTKISSWQVPEEVAELRKKQENDNQRDNSVPLHNVNAVNEKGSSTTCLSAPALTNGGRDSMTLRIPAVPGSSALDLVKKKLQESGTPTTSAIPAVLSGTGNPEVNGSRFLEAAVKGLQSESSKDKPKDTDGNGNTSDTSSDSEDVDSGPTIEERIIQFKEMLKERGVAPFSKWEKELPKIVFDPRFKAIPSYAERRSLFEHYVRTRAEEQRKEKRAAQKAAIEGFKQLLEEAKKDIDESTDYQSFKKKWSHDPRFEGLDRKEREHLLNERVHQLKKASEEKVRAVRAAAASGFKSMLREREDITASSRWSRVKEGLRDDPRYKAVKHEEREALFIEYTYELKSGNDEADRSVKAEKDKLRERERETRKRKEREEQEMERVRLKVRRKEAVASYQSLLVETIKDPQASWKESKPKLEKDPQRRTTNPDLDEADLEKLFREHIKMLHERCVNEFRALLAEFITAEAAVEKTEDGKTVLTSWSTAKQQLKSDQRYKKLPGKERENLWRRHAEDVLRKEDGKHSDPKSKISIDHGRSSLSRSTHERR